MASVYLSQAFAEYARAQVAYAEAMLADHVLDGCGLCRCGRVHPCDARRHWQQMRSHYLTCLDDLVQEAQLVRPYVTSDEQRRPHP
ncbi:hypothetical protein ACNTMW_25160 [Planosporangium sp. 12N6]|uniref:hypothetical protein n=1 Tax=Planosporangium spinosum TaxID=3402278 RepID=UPI003CF944B3